MANLCHFILYSVQWMKIRPTENLCHFDNYMISLNKEIPSLMTIP